MVAILEAFCWDGLIPFVPLRRKVAVNHSVFLTDHLHTMMKYFCPVGIEWSLQRRHCPQSQNFLDECESVVNHMLWPLQLPDLKGDMLHPFPASTISSLRS